MARIITKGLIGLEDLSTGNGTFTRATSTGGTQTLTKLLIGSAGRFESMRFADQFPGADIGAQVNAAIADLPTGGGLIILPSGTSTFSTTISITKPTILMGMGASIGGNVGQRPATRLVYSGSGIAIDVGPAANDTEARGTMLRDFNLENSGTGTIGIRINTQEPKLINVVVYNTTGAAAQFTTAGVQVGDIVGGQVNDFLARDLYVRNQKGVGLQLLLVSEATIDHCRILQNDQGTTATSFNIQIGDATRQAGNVNIIGGTNFSQITTGFTGIKIIRCPFKLVVADSYAECEGAGLAIDASAIVGTDLPNLAVDNCFFTKAVTSAIYAININNATTGATIKNCTFLGFTSAGALNSSTAQFVDINSVLLGGTPVSVSGTVGLVQIYGTTSTFNAVGQLGKTNIYNGMATVSNGIPSELATVDLTAQAAAIGTTTLYAVPSSGAGQYRVAWNAKVTTVDGASSTLGALTIVYTDPDGVVQTITAAAQIAAGTIATTSTGNTTATVLLGLPVILNCKASTNITYAMAYVSNTPGQMKFNLHIKCEAL